MINDFGEKIGGARKDVWKERGLMVEDLNGMTQGEKEKYVKKDCIWPKEDMKALVANGMPRFVVYFRKSANGYIRSPKNRSPRKPTSMVSVRSKDLRNPSKKKATFLYLWTG